jgi:hypothetical protein
MRVSAHLAKAGHRIGATQRIGDRNPDCNPLRSEPPHEIATERRFTSKQMGAAGDVEGKAVRRHEPDQRRIAIAPIGNRLQQTLVCLRIGMFHGKCRIHGARIGKSHPGAQPKAGCSIIEGRDAQRRFDRRDDNERLISRSGQDAREPIGREPSQPNRQIAPGGRRVHDDPR